MLSSPIFTFTFIIPRDAIDEYGHANNVAYVQWMQDAANRHGDAVAYKSAENTGWFVREHHIEYLLPAYLGDELEISTWLGDLKRVRLKRRYQFLRKSDGRLVARGETDFVYVDLHTGRPISIPVELAALFPLASDPPHPAA